MRWQKSPGLIGTEMAGAYTAFDPVRLDYVSFNATAKRIWDALAEPRSVEDIAKDLMAEFDIARQPCIESVERALEELEKRGLVERLN